jgi:NADPH:quinone reductase-like Zn-dependent oxidoreductase
MPAAYIMRHGPADEIQYGLLPIPQFGPTDVLVRVDLVAVNPVDTFVRAGSFQAGIPPFPFIIGRDLVGTVAALGLGVASFRIGEAVWANSLGHGGRQGSFAEYAVVPGERLYRLPSGADRINAVALLHPASTAYLGLYRHAQLRPGETVFVGGGAGNVGSAAIRFVAMAGYRVIASSRPEDEVWCRQNGAVAVVDYRDPDLTIRIRALAREGVDVYLDTSGHHDLDLAVGALAHAGRIVLLAGLKAHPQLPVGALYTKDARLVGFAISNASLSDLAEASSAVNRLPLKESAEAPRMVERGVRGRVVLEVR